MAGNIANFHGKQAAPFGSRKSPATKRKKHSRKTAKGTFKKDLYTALSKAKS